MMTLKRFADCEHSVFVSYAHADNEITGNWIGDFATRLNRELAAELSSAPGLPQPMPSIHLSELNGPVSGELSEQLAERVASSFAMVIVVGDLYCKSAWCLKELQYFVQTFGADGLDTRLYVVALSEPAMAALTQMDSWKTCFAGRNPVWKTFYSNDIDKPLIPVLRGDLKAPTAEFKQRFDPIREELAQKIRKDLSEPAQPAAPRPPVEEAAAAVSAVSVAAPAVVIAAATVAAVAPSAAAASDAAAAEVMPRNVRLYIESNPVERNEWQKIAPQIERRWQTMLASRKLPVPLTLRPRGLNVDAIQDFDLNAADGLILLWGQTERRSLLSHIDMVEDRVDQMAPAIVAYLSPPKPYSQQPLAASGWQVLRFNHSDQASQGDIEPDQADEVDLNRFLNGVLERSSKRYGISLA